MLGYCYYSVFSFFSTYKCCTLWDPQFRIGIPLILLCVLLDEGNAILERDAFPSLLLKQTQHWGAQILKQPLEG